MTAEKSPVTLLKLARAAVVGLPQAPGMARGVGTLLQARFRNTLSVGLVLEDRARQYPDHTALLFEDRRWSYAEFNAWVNRLASMFKGAGVKSGTTVALLAENHAVALAVVAALAKIGAAAGMLNPALRGDALRHSVAAMRPGHFVVAGECVETFSDLETDEASIWWYQGHGSASCPPGWRDLEKQAANGSTGNPGSTAKVGIRQPFCYILTSGTTGMPKASVMSHQRWLKAMGGLGQLSLRLKPEDILYCALPLYHNNALTVSWSATLGAGAALALDRKFSARTFWDRARHYRATSFSYIGELCRYLLAQPTSSHDREHDVRSCIGNGLRPDLWTSFKQRFGIERVCEFYAASEGNMGFVNGFNLDQTAGFCPYSYAIVECDIGNALPQRTARGRLSRVAKGGIGLLLTEVTDAAPFEGYTDAAAGESKLVRSAFTDGDCWYNTGDLVCDQGWKHIQFVDRLGDTFRWKGENVATTEVEAALRDAPGVAEAAVYGVTINGSDGRAGMAAIRLADHSRPLDGAALALHLREVLPAYAVPVFLRVVAELETTATFKTRKQDLKEQGFSAALADPMYLLLPASRAYVLLDEAIRKELEQGRLRL